MPLCCSCFLRRISRLGLVLLMSVLLLLVILSHVVNSYISYRAGYTASKAALAERWEMISDGMGKTINAIHEFGLEPKQPKRRGGGG